MDSRVSQSAPTSNPGSPTPSANGHPTPADSANPASPNPAAPDLFTDLDGLRVDQDFSNLGVKTQIVTVPIRKPAKEWFVRTNKYLYFPTYVLDLKEDREVYFAEKSLWPSLAAEPTFVIRRLTAAMNRQGLLFVWPLRLPDKDDRLDNWGRSALEGAILAQTRWVRIAADTNLGSYTVSVATATDWPEPQWPDLKINEILRIAFKNHTIEDYNHDVLKRLRGEA